MADGWRLRPWLFACFAGSLLLLPAGAAAQRGGPSLEQRVQRLERLMSSTAMLDLMEGVQRLQSELQELRGEVEEQTHTVEQLKQRQRELYLDVDRRLSRMEAGGRSTAAVPATPRMSAGPGRPSPSSAPAVAPSSAAPPGTPDPATASAAPSVDPVKEQAAYNRAFLLLKEGRYEQAAKAFQVFRTEYPGGHYADNAQYWLGETYYVSRKFEPALAEFQKLTKEFPASPKLTHALLKIGYIYDEMGESAKARKVLKGLVANHPKSAITDRAEARLRLMKEEGR